MRLEVKSLFWSNEKKLGFNVNAQILNSLEGAGGMGFAFNLLLKVEGARALP